MPFKCKLIYGKRSKNYLTPHNVRLHELFEYPFKSAFMYMLYIMLCVLCAPSIIFFINKLIHINKK